MGLFFQRTSKSFSEDMFMDNILLQMEEGVDASEIMVYGCYNITSVGREMHPINNFNK